MTTRRRSIELLSAGLGAVGLTRMLHASSSAGLPQPHFPPRAKNVIFLYLNGGLSHVDSFDPKPELVKRDGEPMPGPKIKTDRASGGLMKSPFAFRQGGQSGIEVSEIFPKIGESIDDFCVVRSMYSALAGNNYDSDISRITRNVLRRFLDPRPFPAPE